MRSIKGGARSGEYLIVGDYGTVLRLQGESCARLGGSSQGSIKDLWREAGDEYLMVDDLGQIVWMDVQTLQHHVLSYEPNYPLKNIFSRSPREYLVIGDRRLIRLSKGSIERWGLGPGHNAVLVTKNGYELYARGYGDVCSIDFNKVGEQMGYQAREHMHSFCVTSLHETKQGRLFGVGYRSIHLSPVDPGEVALALTMAPSPKYNDLNWKVISPEQGLKLNKVHGNEQDVIFAVGDGGAVIRYQGGRWVEVPIIGAGALYGVWVGDREVIVVGENGAVFRMDL